MLGVFEVLSYGYDAAGNRNSHRKRDGSVLAYVYDALNRAIRKIVPERASLAAAQTRDVHYDYGHERAETSRSLLSSGGPRLSGRRRRARFRLGSGRAGPPGAGAPVCGCRSRAEGFRS